MKHWDQLSCWCPCWGSSLGADTIRESNLIGQDWVDRTLIGWSTSLSRPWAAPWTCWMLKHCVQPVLSLEGLSLPGWQVLPQEQPRGTCLLVEKTKKKNNKNLHFSSFHRWIRNSPWGWINSKPLFFSFSFSFGLEDTTTHRRQWDPRHPRERWPRRQTLPPLMLQLSKPTDR